MSVSLQRSGFVVVVVVVVVVTLFSFVCSSVQFKMVSMRSEKPIYAPLTPVSQTFPQRCRRNLSCNIRVNDDGPLSYTCIVNTHIFRTR